MNNTYSGIKRFTPNASSGLSAHQVDLRRSEGLLNTDLSIHTKTSWEIIHDNLFTLFNLINVVLALAILYVGSYKNLMFMGVIICNSIIGIIQELRAKSTIDKLSLISSPEVTLIRDSCEVKAKLEDIVLDDIIKYDSGNQIVADCIVVDGICEVNESLLTGEPDAIPKKKGDMLLSGSFVSGGSCFARVEHVGEQNYSSRILRNVKYIKDTKSEIMLALNKIIKIISLLIIPVGVLLFLNQLKIHGFSYQPAVVATSAALIGMIPEGLVLLVSTALAVGVIRLSRKKVLVQDIYCIETLARVDTLCLDKTGTITEGSFEIERAIPQGKFKENQVSNALKVLSGTLDDSNKTMDAIRNQYNPNGEKYAYIYKVPFSSDIKWSGVCLGEDGSFIIGAPEFILSDNNANIYKEISRYSKEFRVLILVHSDKKIDQKVIPDDIEPMALILIKDKIRKDAKETLKYFAEQGVNIKIISGDSAVTVSNIASRVGLSGAQNYIDASSLSTDEEIKRAASEYTVFGRVTPLQKCKIVTALKQEGHTVAMTGDGVNDVLSLKEADCSIAMAQGSEAARNVSQIVLLNSNFSSMPHIVSEGRRAINNIQRASSLFLVKTIYSALLAILFLFISAPYPFIPIQMTLVNALAIGIPSFILALEPNNERVVGNLFREVLGKALPAAIIIVLNIMVCIFLYETSSFGRGQYSTACVILTGLIEILLLYKISLPLNIVRKFLICFITVGFITGITLFKKLFSISMLSLTQTIILAVLTFVSCLLYSALSEFQRGFRKSNK